MTSIQETLERVLSLSKADECIAIGFQSSSTNVRWAGNTSTTNGISETTNLIIISIIGRSVGTIAINYFPEDRLESLVRESEAACEGKPEAEDYVPLLEGEGPAAGWDDPYEPTDLAVFDALVPDLVQMFKRAEADGIKTFGYAEHSASTISLATSTGVRRRHRDVDGSVEITAKTPDFALSAWVERLTKTLQDVDLDALYHRLERRLEWSKTSLSLPPGRYPVILEPAAVAEMMLHAYISSTARDADEGRSAFSKAGGGNRIGEKLYPPSITIYSDPDEPGLEAAPFTLSTASSSYSSIFDNGMEAKRIEWVKDGVLKGLITPRHWAAKTGAEPRPFIGNLIIAGEDGKSLDEMIASTERALLVTRFWYIRTVDPQTLLLTGLTRDGVFLIEDGQVKGAVNNFRFNMSPIQMLAQTTEIGPSERSFSFAKMPALRVDDFHMSSVSQAT